MWRVCFGDSQPYFDIYFREKYRDENTLACFVGDKVVASLQLLLLFHLLWREISVAYISGVCTLPEERKKGYMEFSKYTFVSYKRYSSSILVQKKSGCYDFTISMVMPDI